MNLRFLPLVLALTTVAPLAVHAQRMPNPQEMPAPDFQKIPPIKMGTTISGTITAKDLAYVTKKFGQVKCSQFQVTLQESNPNDVIVQVPGQPKKSKFPDSYAPVTVQATGNHLGLGCNYSLTVPDNAKGKQGYLVVLKGVENKQGDLLVSSPQGWQNPMPVPTSGSVGRNFVVNVSELNIK